MISQLRTIQILEKVEWFCLGFAVSAAAGLGTMGILGYFALCGVGLVEW